MMVQIKINSIDISHKQYTLVLYANYKSINWKRIFSR